MVSSYSQWFNGRFYGAPSSGSRVSQKIEGTPPPQEEGKCHPTIWPFFFKLNIKMNKFWPRGDTSCVHSRSATLFLSTKLSFIRLYRKWYNAYGWCSFICPCPFSFILNCNIFISIWQRITVFPILCQIQWCKLIEISEDKLNCLVCHFLCILYRSIEIPRIFLQFLRRQQVLLWDILVMFALGFPHGSRLHSLHR